MKLIVVHGDNTEAIDSRIGKFIKAASSRGFVITRVNPVKERNLADLLSKRSLFGDKTLLLISNATKLDKKDKELIKSSANFDITLVIYNYKKLSKSFLNSLPEITKEEQYELPKLLFVFLESFFPGNSRDCITTLHELTIDSPVEMVFVMLARHLRDLYWVKVDPSTIPYPSWRVGKLERQAARFGKEKLANIINKLSLADVASKTSRAKILDSLDLIILTELE